MLAGTIVLAWAWATAAYAWTWYALTGSAVTFLVAVLLSFVPTQDARQV
jgi:hypothetical protein